MIATSSASDRLVASAFVCDLDFCVLDPAYSACPMQCFVKSNVELRVEGMPLLCLVVGGKRHSAKVSGLVSAPSAEKVPVVPLGTCH